MTKPGSREIIITEQLKPRAVILGQDFLDRTKLLNSSFIGKDAVFYAAQAARIIASPVTVVGCTITDCFEMALRKSPVYIGDNADYYMRLELEQNGFTPRIVSLEDFDKLLAGVPSNETHQT